MSYLVFTINKKIGLGALLFVKCHLLTCKNKVVRLKGLFYLMKNL